MFWSVDTYGLMMCSSCCRIYSYIFSPTSLLINYLSRDMLCILFFFKPRVLFLIWIMMVQSLFPTMNLQSSFSKRMVLKIYTQWAWKGNITNLLFFLHVLLISMVYGILIILLESLVSSLFCACCGLLYFPPSVILYLQNASYMVSHNSHFLFELARYLLFQHLTSTGGLVIIFYE
jgi:hypothetical protein